MVNCVVALDVETDYIKSVPKPSFSKFYGEWHLLKIIKKRVQYTESHHEDRYVVLQVDGINLENSIIVDVEFVNKTTEERTDAFDVACYEFIKSFGVPDNSPNGYGISQTKVDFHMRSMVFAYSK